MKKTVAIVGGGSWGTALINTLAKNNKAIDIVWWMRNAQMISYIKEYKTNPFYLKGCELELSKIKLSSTFDDLSKADFLILAIPSQAIQNLVSSNKSNFEGKIIINAAKGLIDKQNISSWLKSKLLNSEIITMTGPSHSEEVMKQKHTYLCLAGQQTTGLLFLQIIFENNWLKVAVSEDQDLLEMGAALKNVYAIGSGMLSCLAAHNLTSVFTSKAYLELENFLKKPFTQKSEVSSVFILGDLLVTCFSGDSRNFRFGQLLAQEKTIHQACQILNMVVEGFENIKQIDVTYLKDLPLLKAIIDCVYSDHKQNSIQKFSQDLIS